MINLNIDCTIWNSDKTKIHKIVPLQINEAVLDRVVSQMIAQNKIELPNVDMKDVIFDFSLNYE